MLQNWFDPILNFEPGNLQSSTAGNIFNPDGAMSYSPPSVAISPQNEVYLLLSGHTNPFSTNNNGNNNSGLWMAYEQGGLWNQMDIVKGDNASSYSPSAAFFNGNLYVAYSDVSGNIWITYTTGGISPEDATWEQYQVITTSDESTSSSPTLVVEANRLALYFPSGNSANNNPPQNLQYLYSLDPGNQGSPSNGNGNWGSQYNSTTSSYGTLSNSLTLAMGLTSPIAATTFQGRTVLAFRGYNSSGSGNNVANGEIFLATQNYSATETLTTSGGSLDWTITNTGKSNVNGLGLTSDQALLYLTSSGPYGSFPSSNLWSVSPVSPGSSTWNPPVITTMGGSPSLANEMNYGVMNPFFMNGQLMAAWTNSSYEIQLANLDIAVSAPVQQSLAGYSLDGNIDVNGDGFTDILLSDPTDPAMGVNN
jgi:hypothetical protein